MMQHKTEENGTWAKRELSQLQADLGDNWRVWHVPSMYSEGWCAMPAGALISTCVAGDPETLRRLVADYAQNIPEHIAGTRAELERTPPELSGRRDVLQALLSALERIMMEPKTEDAENLT